MRKPRSAPVRRMMVSMTSLRTGGEVERGVDDAGGVGQGAQAGQLGLLRLGQAGQALEGRAQRGEAIHDARRIAQPGLVQHLLLGGEQRFDVAGQLAHITELLGHRIHASRHTSCLSRVFLRLVWPDGPRRRWGEPPVANSGSPGRA